MAIISSPTQPSNANPGDVWVKSSTLQYLCVSAVLRSDGTSSPTFQPIGSGGGSGAVSSIVAGTGIGVSGATGDVTVSVTTVPVANGGTNVASYTKGDILVASAGTTLTKLGVGSNGKVLTAASGETTGTIWSTPVISAVNAVSVTNSGAQSLAAAGTTLVWNVATTANANMHTTSGSTTGLCGALADNKCIRIPNTSTCIISAYVNFGGTAASTTPGNTYVDLQLNGGALAGAVVSDDANDPIGAPSASISRVRGFTAGDKITVIVTTAENSRTALAHEEGTTLSAYCTN